MNSSILTLAATTESNNLEELASMYSNFSTVAFILAIICLAFAIFTFFAFHIPTIFGDLSGISIRREINKTRKNNEKSGEKSFRAHPVASERGKLTVEINSPQSTENSSAETMQLKSSIQNNQTDIMSINSNETEKLFIDTNETEKLSYDPNGTEILSANTDFSDTPEIDSVTEIKQVEIRYIQNIVLINTDEII